MLVKQIVNLKKVVVDSDLKVSLTLEFIAADRAGKERVFELIKMQGEVLEASFEQAQVARDGWGSGLIIEIHGGNVVDTGKEVTVSPRYFLLGHCRADRTGLAS
jgi:hypothetical protein